MLRTVLTKHHTTPFLKFVVSEPNPYETFQYTSYKKGHEMVRAWKTHTKFWSENLKV